MKRMFRYGLVGLAIVLVAMLAIGPATTLGDYHPKIQAALMQPLMHALFGDVLANNNIAIIFGSTGAAIATTSYAGGNYTITIDSSYTGKDVEVIKALLAHELIHVKWAANGTGQLATGNLTFDEEYEAWETEAVVWRAVRGGLADVELDYGEDVIFTTTDIRKKDDVRKELEQINYTFTP
jgi:hypothetical protein